LAPPGAKTDAVSPGRSRAQKRVVWSLEAETRRWPSGWKVRAQTFESWAWERVARGGIWGAGAVSTPGVVEEGEVEVWEVEGVEVVAEELVPGVGEERSQWRMAPSEPPETRMGWTGCHANAVYEELKGGWVQAIWNVEREGRDVQQTSFLCPRKMTHSFIERISNTRTVWSRDALASWFPCGAHARACMVFLC
jgi:hypothetical protein